MNTIAQPFAWLLMFFYNLVNNYALALLFIAIAVRILLLPFQMKGKRGMMRQSRLQPKIAEIQKKHGANKQKLNEEMAKLYKEEGVNPASGCLWSFIQMPIMIALFFAIRQPLTLMMGVARGLLAAPDPDAGITGGAIYLKLEEMGFIATMNPYYLEIEQAQFITANFDAFSGLSEHLQKIYFTLGRINLGETPDFRFWEFPWDNATALFPILILFLFPLLSGGAQFISAGIMRKMSPAGSPEAAKGTMGTVMKLMPLMSVWFGFILPAALSLYWTIGTVLQIGQDIWLTKKYTKILDEEDAEKAIIRKAKEAEIEAKRLETEKKKAEGLAEQNRNTSKRKKQKSNRQEQQDKAAEWEKKNTPVIETEEKHEPSRVGNRKFARGRAYDPDRYSGNACEESEDTTDEIEDNEIEQTTDEPYEYSGEDNRYTVDSSDEDDFEDDDDDYVDDDGDDDDYVDDGDDDDDDIKDNDSDSDDEDDDEDEDDEDNLSSGKFETKRFD